jgi:hypothetical protein
MTNIIKEKIMNSNKKTTEMEDMKNNGEKINPNMTARIAGALYLLLAPLGFFGTMYIPSITVPGMPWQQSIILCLTKCSFV